MSYLTTGRNLVLDDTRHAIHLYYPIARKIIPDYFSAQLPPTPEWLKACEATCGKAPIIENYFGTNLQATEISKYRFLDDAKLIRDRFSQISHVRSDAEGLNALKDIKRLMDRLWSDAEKLDSSCSELALSFNWHVVYLGNLYEAKGRDSQSSQIKKIAFAVMMLAVAFMVTFGIVFSTLWLPAALVVYGICISTIIKAIKAIKNSPISKEEIPYFQQEVDKSLNRLEQIDLSSIITPKPPVVIPSSQMPKSTAPHVEEEKAEEAIPLNVEDETSLDNAIPSSSRIFNAIYWVWETATAPCRVRRRHITKQLDN